MNGCDKGIWLRSNDGAGADIASIGAMPEIPQTGKGKWAAIFERHIHGSLAHMLFLPFIETIGDHQAAS